MPTPESHSPAEIADVIADQCLVMRVRYLNRSLTAIYEEAFRPLGLTASQGNMLVAIVKQRELSPTQLGQILNLEKSTLSRNLSRMRDAGWIEILEPEQGRLQTLRATTTGKQLLTRLHPCWQQAQAQAAQLLGETGADELRSAADHVRRQLSPS